MSEEFDKWNTIKKETNQSNPPIFKDREIYYTRMGHNIGHEQNGKGEEFVRPVVILKRLSREMFIGIPLSSQLKEGSFYHTINFTKRGEPTQNRAIIAQIKLFSARRLLNKIGMIDKEEFSALKQKVNELLDLTPLSK